MIGVSELGTIALASSPPESLSRRKEPTAVMTARSKKWKMWVEEAARAAISAPRRRQADTKEATKNARSTQEMDMPYLAKVLQ